VEKLRTVFGEVFVDGLTTDVLMLKARYKSVNGYFFYFNTKIATADVLCIQRKRLSYYESDFDDDFQPHIPHLLLSFDKEKDLTEDDGMLAERFLQAMYDPRNHVPEEFFELVPRPVKIQNSAPEKDLTPPELLPDYSFEYKVDTGMDIAFCQVHKPFTDKPYTLVIRNFDQRGLKCFFSGIFAATSWGVSSHDIAFLHKLWKFLDMEKEYGKLDLEMLLKDHVQRCTEDHEMEPEVYRLDYKTVHKNFEKSLAKKHRLLE
jgi:hypothetical protein